MRDKNAGKSQMLRLDSELWERIGRLAAGGGKTPRQEIERRLRQSLAETPDNRLTPARAMARLIEMLADDLASYSQSATEWHGDMRAASRVLLDELFKDSHEGSTAAARESQSDGFAEAAARALAQKVLRAHLPRQRTGENYWAAAADRAAEQELPSLGRGDDLLKIQVALGLSPEGQGKVATGGRQTPGKGKR